MYTPHQHLVVRSGIDLGPVDLSSDVPPRCIYWPRVVLTWVQLTSAQMYPPAASSGQEWYCLGSSWPQLRYTTKQHLVAKNGTDGSSGPEFRSTSPQHLVAMSGTHMGPVDLSSDVPQLHLVAQTGNDLGPVDMSWLGPFDLSSEEVITKIALYVW